MAGGVKRPKLTGRQMRLEQKPSHRCPRPAAFRSVSWPSLTERLLDELSLRGCASGIEEVGHSASQLSCSSTDQIERS